MPPVNLHKILCAIGTTKEASFNDFCVGLGDDLPKKGDKDAWRQVLTLIEDAEKAGLAVVSRVKNRINTLSLTQSGADSVRDALDSNRGLLNCLEPQQCENKN
jgi:hypothetical protein